jgi:cytoskeletal protein CcmA (bactofilin family)
MRDERGQLKHDLVVYEEYTLWGSVVGNVKVIKGGKFYLRGAIYGNLRVEPGGRVHIFGNVSGDLTLVKHTKVIVSGTIGGDAVNRGGRLYIDTSAKLLGKLKTKSGETTQEQRRA